MSQRRFGLFEFHDGGKEPIFEANELEEIGEFVAEKAGRGVVWEWIEDGD